MARVFTALPRPPGADWKDQELVVQKADDMRTVQRALLLERIREFVQNVEIEEMHCKILALPLHR